MALTDEELRRSVREAIGRIEPLPFSRGPNFYTVDVDGWGLSAPTRPQVARMLWDWFNERRPVAVAAWDHFVATLKSQEKHP